MQSKLKLGPAIATQAVEDVASEALRMDANQWRVAGKIAHLKDDRFLRRIVACPESFKSEDSKMPETGGKIRFSDFAGVERVDHSFSWSRRSSRLPASRINWREARDGVTRST